MTLWDVDKGRVRATCAGHEGTVRALAFHPGDNRLVSAGFDGTIRFWNTRTGPEAGEPIRLAGKSSNCVAVSPDGTLLASSTDRGSDDPGWGGPSPGFPPRSGTGAAGRSGSILKGHRYHILSVSFSPDGKTLSFGGRPLRGRHRSQAVGRRFGPGAMQSLGAPMVGGERGVLARLPLAGEPGGFEQNPVRSACGT